MCSRSFLASPGVYRAHALMDPASGSDVIGTVDFMRLANGDINVKYFFSGKTKVRLLTRVCDGMLAR